MVASFMGVCIDVKVPMKLKVYLAYEYVSLIVVYKQCAPNQ